MAELNRGFTVGIAENHERIYEIFTPIKIWVSGQINQEVTTTVLLVRKLTSANL